MILPRMLAIQKFPLISMYIMVLLIKEILCIRLVRMLIGKQCLEIGGMILLVVHHNPQILILIQFMALGVIIRQQLQMVM